MSDIARKNCIDRKMSVAAIGRADRFRLPRQDNVNEKVSKTEKRRKSRRKGRCQLHQEQENETCKPPSKPKSAWDSLEEQISQIAGNTMFKSFQSTPLNARSSDTFNRVMGDMKAKLAEQRAAAEAARQAREAAARASIVPEAGEEEDDDFYSDYSDDDDPVPVISPLRQTALRGWQVLRRKMRDLTIERKKNNSSFNWSFLTHHLSNRNDHQKAREELYEKYIYKPTNWADGLVNIPPSVLDKLNNNNRNANQQSGTRSALTRENSKVTGGRRPNTSPVKSTTRNIQTKRFY